jgi:hypothetical protein
MHYLGGWWQVVMIVNPVLQEKPAAASAGAQDGASAGDAEGALSTAADGAVVAAEGAAGGAEGKPGDRRKSLSKEERYERPMPPLELLRNAKFAVKALKFVNEHDEVPAAALRPLWVWKRKGGNQLTKQGKKKQSMGGAQDGAHEGAHEDGGAPGAQDGAHDGAHDGAQDGAHDGAHDGAAEGSGDLKEGDVLVGMWGKSRGREGKNFFKGGVPAFVPTLRMGEAKAVTLTLKEAMLLQEQALMAAQQEALAQLGAAGYRESVVQGEMVEVRAGLEFGEEFESSRWLVKILQCDPINRRCEIEYVDFDDEETPGKKLTDWVDYWAVRPIPPKGVQFGLKTAWLRKLTPGSCVEVLYALEDPDEPKAESADDQGGKGWWDADLIGIYSEEVMTTDDH